MFANSRGINTLSTVNFRLLTWCRQWHPTPVLLPGKSHGRRSLVGCSPWDCEESDTTEWLQFHFSLRGIGEGNGNPLQCSCLETPRDGRAWLAAVYGVAQSRKQLKRLSSSSSNMMSLSVELGREANSWLSGISQMQHTNGSFKTTAWIGLTFWFWNDSYLSMTRMSLGFWVTSGLLLTPGIEHVELCIDLLYVLTVVLALVYITPRQWACF